MKVTTMFACSRTRRVARIQKCLECPGVYVKSVTLDYLKGHSDTWKFLPQAGIVESRKWHGFIDDMNSMKSTWCLVVCIWIRLVRVLSTYIHRAMCISSDKRWWHPRVGRISIAGQHTAINRLMTGEAFDNYISVRQGSSQYMLRIPGPWTHGRFTCRNALG